MNIIIVTAGMTGGGTERVISVLSNFLVCQGHKVSIIMTANAEIVYQLEDRVSLTFLGGRTGGSIKKRIERISKLRAIFKKDENGIILSFGMETNLFTTIAGLGLKNKVILSERNDPNQCNFKLLRKIIYSFADGYVFQTIDAKKYFGKRIDNKGVVIPNPIKDALPEYYDGERRKRIVTVGRLQPQKNHILLIHAFAEFQKKYSSYELVIYGRGELLDTLRQLAKELKIDSKVVFAGFTENVIEHIKDASIFILSSDYEGISNSLLEAMAIGIPVISTDCPIGGSSLLIQNQVNGLLIPVGGQQELVSAMTYLVEHQDIAEQLAREARKVRYIYSTEIICKDWLEYMDMIGKNGE